MKETKTRSYKVVSCAWNSFLFSAINRKTFFSFSTYVHWKTDHVRKWHSGRCQGPAIRPWYELDRCRIQLACLIWNKCSNCKDASFNKV